MVDHKKEFRRIRKLSKGLVSRSQLRKLRAVRDPVLRSEGLKHLVVSHFKLKHLDLEHRGEEKRVASLILDAKLRLLREKIRVLETSHEERDYNAVLKLVIEIEGELWDYWGS